MGVSAGAQQRPACPGAPARRAALTAAARAALLAFIAFAGAFVPREADAQARAIVVHVAPIELVDAGADADTTRMRGAVTVEGLSARMLLRAALAETMRFRIAESGDSATACASLVCAVDVGRRANADAVVWGRITRVSSLIWVLSLSMASVADSTVVRQETVEIKGDPHEVLPAALALLARRLASPDSTILRYSTGRARLDGAAGARCRRTGDLPHSGGPFVDATSPLRQMSRATAPGTTDSLACGLPLPGADSSRESSMWLHSRSSGPGSAPP